MRQIKATPITHENFASFGQFYTMENPSGYPLSGEIHRFFPDRLSASCGTSVGYSPILVKKPAPERRHDYSLRAPFQRDSRAGIHPGVSCSQTYPGEVKRLRMASGAFARKCRRAVRHDYSSRMHLLQ